MEGNGELDSINELIYMKKDLLKKKWWVFTLGLLNVES